MSSHICLLLFLIQFITPFREIRAALPGYGYSSRKSSATQSYKYMLDLFVFVSVVPRNSDMDYGIFDVRM